MNNENNIERPYENAEFRNEKLTVGRLKEFLDKLPDDYYVSFDSALGRTYCDDFTIYHDERKISING